MSLNVIEGEATSSILSERLPHRPSGLLATTRAAMPWPLLSISSTARNPYNVTREESFIGTDALPV